MLRTARALVLLLALSIVVGTWLAPIAGATPMRLDPSSLRTFTIDRDTDIAAADSFAGRTCVAGETWTTDVRHAIAFTCSSALRGGVRIQPRQRHYIVAGVAVDATGAVIVGCSRPSNGSGSRTPFVLRVGHDGAIAQRFGEAGLVDYAGAQAVPGHPDSCATDVDIADDGSITVLGVGRATASGNDNTSWIRRFTATGAVDTALAGTGVQLLDAPGKASTYLIDVAILQDGRAFAVGYVRAGSGGTARYDAIATVVGDGGLDGSFGTGGFDIRAQLPGTAAFFQIVDRANDQRPAFPVVVSGSVNVDGLVRPYVERVGAGGGRVAGFGTGVSKRLPITLYSGDDGFQGLPIVEQPDGRLTIAAERFTWFDTDSFVTRLSAAGSFATGRGYFFGVEPIDTRVGHDDDEYVTDLVPGARTPTVYGSAMVGGRWVGQSFRASAPSVRPASRPSLALRAASPARCGRVQRLACRVRRGTLATFESRIAPTLGPALHPGWARAQVAVHTLGRSGVTRTRELRARLQRNGRSWVWVASARLPRGQYIATVNRNAGSRTGASESLAPYWFNVS